MAAAIATLETILAEGFLESCRKMGEYLQERLWSLRKDHPVVQEVRGKGLLVGSGSHRRGQFHREGLPRAGGSHKLYV